MAIKSKSGGCRSDYLEEPITHLAYIDDINVYTSGREELNVIVGTIETTAEALGIKLGKTKFRVNITTDEHLFTRTEKCAVISVLKGRIKEGDILTPAGCTVQELYDRQTYEYLGVHETITRVAEKTIRGVETECLKRVEKVWTGG